jgi:hypothetical protein
MQNWMKLRVVRALLSPGDSIFAHAADADIPTFDLGRPLAPSPPPATPSPVEPPSPRRASFSTGKRPGRSSSGSSNRSTSFSIPDDFTRGEVQVESSDEEAMSPEGTWYTVEGVRRRC